MAEPKASENELPKIDFATFVLSLSHSALMHLGEAPHPETNEVSMDLALAKQNIDLLGLLEEKTKGNLSFEEQRLIDNALTELRFRYVQILEASKKKQEPESGTQG